MSDALQPKLTVPTKTQLPKLHHVPEAMSALETELTNTLQALDELEKKLETALNPLGLNVEATPKPEESSKRAPLADRIWMNVQTVQTLHNRIDALTLRMEL